MLTYKTMAGFGAIQPLLKFYILCPPPPGSINLFNIIPPFFDGNNNPSYSAKNSHLYNLI
jgi:hypothetical protein